MQPAVGPEVPALDASRALQLGEKREENGTMSNEENKVIVRRFFEEVLGKKELNVADEILASDCKLNSADDPSIKIDDRDGIKEFIGLLHEASPAGLQVNVEEQIAEEDKVVTSWTVTGVHENEILGMPPTGNRLAAQGMSVSTVSDGTISEISESHRSSVEVPVMPEPQAYGMHWWKWS
jgi:predicted ester cyclase